MRHRDASMVLAPAVDTRNAVMLHETQARVGACAASKAATACEASSLHIAHDASTRALSQRLAWQLLGLHCCEVASLIQSRQV